MSKKMIALLAVSASVFAACSQATPTETTNTDDTTMTESSAMMESSTEAMNTSTEAMMSEGTEVSAGAAMSVDALAQ